MSTVLQSDKPRASNSPLLEKVRRLGLSLPVDLERLAILRGCDYYDRELPSRDQALGNVALSNAELAIALVSPLLKPTAREIRLSAALLGSPNLDPDEIVGLAVQETCVEIVRYIAQCGRRFESENAFWQKMLRLLPDVRIDDGKLPHPTRFVEMTGIDRGKVGLRTRWIRPRQALAS